MAVVPVSAGSPRSSATGIGRCPVFPTVELSIRCAAGLSGHRTVWCDCGGAGSGVDDVYPALVDTLSVLGALVRRHGQFDACEDAVQEALLAATVQWPADGVPERPRSWLLTVASRALVDYWRTDSARRREATVALDPTQVSAVEPHDAAFGAQDTLVLLFLCCHPVLSPPSQLALTLRAVGGLSTAQIAAAFLVPETTMAQRIGRAKQRIRDAGAQFQLPPRAEREQRLGVVMHVLYLVFNEGRAARSFAVGAAYRRAPGRDRRGMDGRLRRPRRRPRRFYSTGPPHLLWPTRRDQVVWATDGRVVSRRGSRR